MKICFVTGTIFNLGGIQRVTTVIANELSKYYDVHIFCTYNQYIIDRQMYGLNPKISVTLCEEFYKIPLYKKIVFKVIKLINSNLLFSNYQLREEFLEKVYYPIEVQRKLKDYINDNQFDVVIGVGGIYSTLLGSISNSINSKTIGWMHNSFDAYHRTPKRYLWRQDRLCKSSFRKLDHCVVLTNNDRFQYKENFSVLCDTIYNPVSFKSTLMSTCENKNILFVGRLVKHQKGLDYLIDILNKLSKEDSQWNLIVVGDGEDKEYFLKEILDLQLNDRIRYYSHCTDIEKYYLESSILLSTSRWEGFGLVLIEAMECGIPVVSFDNTGPHEIINKPNENGYLVPVGNTDKMVEILLNLMDNLNLRKNIGKDSKLRAQYFKIEKIIPLWINLIEE